MKYILLGFFLRLLVAIWNGFFGPSIGADGDALLFHDIAVEVSRFGVFDTKFNIGWLYSYFLGIIYFLTTLNSIFLGSVLSCLAWLASALILNKSIKLLGVDQKYRDRALILYAIIPSSILFTSVTLREVYQLLFVNLLFFSSLKILLEGNHKFWFLILISSFCMGALHFGLVLYGILGALITLYFTSIKDGKILSIELILFYIPLLSLFIYLGLNLFDQLVPFDFEDGLAAAVQSYQSGHNETRAMYTYKPEIEGLIGLIIFIPISLFQYLLEPMPWKISTSLDIALFFENIFRVALIIFAINNLLKVKSYLKTPLVYSILMFFALEILWALGTVNWGSAVRHHIPAMGILMIIGICFLDPNLRSKKIVKRLNKQYKV
tara:strand:+ start:37186 stop:38322 length:1137 start_codon:yes stop_codon:yes gene_type:complete